MVYIVINPFSLEWYLDKSTRFGCEANSVTDLQSREESERASCVLPAISGMRAYVSARQDRNCARP